MTEIRIAETQAEREAIYRLRYEIYYEQQQMFVDSADYENRWHSDANDEHAILLYAEVEGEVVGTMRILSGARAPFDDEAREAYDIPRFEKVTGIDTMWTFSRFLVKPELRGGPLAFQFIVAAADLSIELEVELAFCDCEPHLLNLYTSIGFRTYRTVFNEGGMGVMVPLVMIPSDLEHVRRIGSPLCPNLEKRTRSRDIAKPLCALLEHTPPVIGEEHTDRDTYEAMVVGFLDERPELPPLFEGLDPVEVETVLKRSHVIGLGKGDNLIRSGQASRTLFLVLEGSLEVREHGKLVGVASKGEALGEVAFLLGGCRMSDVTAITDDVRVVALNDSGLRELIESDSSVAARLLLYLSKCLCLKLRERSRGAATHPAGAG